MCDDSFDTPDMQVACRELGFTGSGSPSFSCCHNTYGLTIWMDDLRCRGTESSLADCSFNGWGSHNCGNENVVLTCGKLSQDNIDNK